jgi:novel protein kinase C delta type
MLIGQSPFSGCDEDELFWSICNEIPWYPHFLSKEALKILQSVSFLHISCLYYFYLNIFSQIKLLEKDVTIRLGVMGGPEGDIKYHPFFNDINWEKLDKRELDPPFKPQVVSIFE